MDKEFYPYYGMDTVDCGEDPSRWAVRKSEELKLEYLTDNQFRVNRVNSLVVGLHTRCQLDCIFCTAHHAPGKDLLENSEISVERLIEQIHEHKRITGANIARVKYGCVGEVLIHRRFAEIIRKTEDAVDDFTILSNLSISNPKPIEFIAEHPRITHLTISCDAGDAHTYARLRTGGDFGLVMKNAEKLAKAGKKLSLHAIGFKDNEESLMKLPRILKETGFEDLYIIYSFTPLEELRGKGVRKPTREEYKSFFVKLADECKRQDLLLSTSTCFFTPDMVGIIPGIETEERLRSYRVEPCPNLYWMTLTPDGTYYHCCYLENMGYFPKDEGPFYEKGLLEMYNDPAVLAHRKLQMLGYFPELCKKICSKVDNPGTETRAALTHSLKYPDSLVSYSLPEFDRLMAGRGKGFVIRALSPAVRQVLEAYPRLAGEVEFIIDRDPHPQGARHPVVSPEDFLRNSGGKKVAVLIASEREAVFSSVLESVERFDEIYRLNFSNRPFSEYRVTKVLP